MRRIQDTRTRAQNTSHVPTFALAIGGQYIIMYHRGMRRIGWETKQVEERLVLEDREKHTKYA